MVSQNDIRTNLQQQVSKVSKVPNMPSWPRSQANRRVQYYQHSLFTRLGQRYCRTDEVPS